MKYLDLKNKKNIRKAKKKSRGKSKKKTSGKGKFLRYLALIPVLLILVTVTALLLSEKARSILDPVSIVASFNTAELEETDGRTNVLLLGSDRRADDPAGLPERADTVVVASIGRLDKNIVLISVPRDLWVESPVCGRCKITEVYAYATISGADSSEEAMVDVVEEVLGIPVHYYAVINFDLFEDIIDTLGGVTVNVENAFDDYMYPIEGKEDDLCGLTQEEVDELLGLLPDVDDPEAEFEDESLDVSEIPEDPAVLEEILEEEGRPSPLEVVPCRYEHIRFEAGLQEMDGATALKFVRSRHGNNNEGSDFARAARQQRVIMAVKDKATSLGTLLNFKKVQELHNLYQDTVITSIDFGTLQEMYLLSQQVDFSEIRTIVLDDRSAANEGGLLYAPVDTSLYRGSYVLLPRAGTYTQIHAYVQKFLFGK